MAASITPTPEFQSGSFSEIDLLWVADGSGAASLPVHNLAGVLAQVEIDPGTPAPAANHTIKLNDAGGFDVFAGQAAKGDLSATVTTRFSPQVPSSDGTTVGTFPVVVIGIDPTIHTLVIANAGAGGSGTVRLYFKK